METFSKSKRRWVSRLIDRVAQQAERVRKKVKLIESAVLHGGGFAATIKKAVRILRDEGLRGVRRSLKNVENLYDVNAELFTHPVFQKTATRASEDILPPSVLIIAEISLPQCKKYRVDQKKELIELLGIPCTTIDRKDSSACIQALQHHSIVIFYRVPDGKSFTKLMSEAHRLRIPTIWEIDDFMFDRDVLIKNNALKSLDKDTINNLLKDADLFKSAMLSCDRGIAATHCLANVMKKDGVPEVYVVECTFDAQTRQITEELNKNSIPRKDQLIRIAYGTGTNMHDNDFLQAADAIVSVLEKHQNVRFRIMGRCELPRSFAKHALQVESYDFKPYSEYLQLMSECDINIAPLEDSFTNDTKTNVKYIEASALNMPSVCSPRSAYTQIVTHNINGFLCDTQEEWADTLTILINDAALRTRIGKAAYNTVMSCYSPLDIAQKQIFPIISDTFKAQAKPTVLSVNCYYHPRSFGGATIVAEEVNSSLYEDNGFNVHVFTTINSGAMAPYALKRYEASGVNVYAVCVPIQLDENSQFENNEMNAPFEKVLEATKPDIVHFHCIQGIGANVIDICNKRKIRFVITLHDAWWLCQRQFMVDKKKQYCSLLAISTEQCGTCCGDTDAAIYRSNRLKAALALADRLLVPSAFFAKLYSTNGFDPSRIIVNRNGITEPKAIERFRQNCPLRFGYVGGNNPVKGVHIVQAAFRSLAQCNLKLVIADNTLTLGFSSYSQADFAGIPNVEIVPAYTQNSVDDFYDRIDVLLFPSQWKESFGLAVREALARNIWVITTDAGGAVEGILPGKNGFIIPLEDDGEGLRQAIVDTCSVFDTIKPGESISFEHGAPTYFKDQAQELAAILKQVLSE